MKKFLITILKFLPVALVIYLLMLIAWCSVTPLYLHRNMNYFVGGYGHMNSRMKDAKKTGKIDVLIMGSSHAYRGFDPRIFEQHGVKAFNMGSSSQSPMQTLMLLKKYLDQMSPELVILEVYPEIFCIDGVESSLDVLGNEKIDRHVAEMVYRVGNIKVFNTFVYANFRNLFGFDNDFSQPDDEDADHYIPGTGYVARDLSNSRYLVHPVSEWKFNRKQLKAFDDVIDYLNEKKVKFILVQAPLSKALYNSKSNNDKADNLFRNRGFYLNCNGKIALDDSLHFYDADHLNQEGVKIFNDAFLKWMKEKNLIQEKN